MVYESMGRALHVLHFGRHLVRHSVGIELQEALAEARKANLVPDTLLVLQHHPVFSLGKRGHSHDLRKGENDLKAEGFDVSRIGRGGQATYHGPGQVVLYPVVNVRELGKGVRRFVEGLEDCMINAALSFGVHAHGRVPGATGVWVGDKKLGAVGIKVSDGISTHGLAFNVAKGLADQRRSPFSLIVPCGMDKVKITSLEAETTQEHDMETVMGALAESYSSVFGYDDVLVADVPADAVGQFVTEIVTEIAEGHADHDDS